MPERINPEHPRRVEWLLITGTVGVVFLTAFVIFSLVTGNPEAERINAKLDRSLELLAEGQASQRASVNANACTGYLNHRAIEQTLQNIAVANRLEQTPTVVLPSDETRRACAAAGIPIDDKSATIQDSHE